MPENQLSNLNPAWFGAFFGLLGAFLGFRTKAYKAGRSDADIATALNSLREEIAEVKQDVKDSARSLHNRIDTKTASISEHNTRISRIEGELKK